MTTLFFVILVTKQALTRSKKEIIPISKTPATEVVYFKKIGNAFFTFLTMHRLEFFATMGNFC
jgi:hypothetical protein